MQSISATNPVLSVLSEYLNLPNPSDYTIIESPLQKEEKNNSSSNSEFKLTPRTTHTYVIKFFNILKSITCGIVNLSNYFFPQNPNAAKSLITHLEELTKSSADSALIKRALETLDSNHFFDNISQTHRLGYRSLTQLS